MADGNAFIRLNIHLNNSNRMEIIDCFLQDISTNDVNTKSMETINFIDRFIDKQYININKTVAFRAIGLNEVFIGKINSLDNMTSFISTLVKTYGFNIQYSYAGYASLELLTNTHICVVTIIEYAFVINIIPLTK